VIESLLAGLKAISLAEAISVVLGLAYLLLAIRRVRWCWVAGGVSSAILVYLSLRARLPMQAALQVYYVAMSVYGFWHWSKDEKEGSRVITTWPIRYHVFACAGILVISVLTARWFGEQTQAAWPFLDSLTTWGSLFTTWLVARVKLENFLYWIIIDSLLAFLFAAQELYFVALLSVVYVGIVIAGYFSWRKTYRAQLLTT
jgi:nicotinamide mononucleotide transporter